ncbi:hypothetical protein BJV77DRAFT_1049352 [Russula vinacea]|nr:hypothetical protein BJV77DRAFT_1049352 [Russula vinacea]
MQCHTIRVLCTVETFPPKFEPPAKHRPEDTKLTRTPISTACQVGAGFFTISSTNNSGMHLIAHLRDIKASDEIMVSYVNAAVPVDEDVVQARYHPRKDLAERARCNHPLLEGMRPASFSCCALFRASSTVFMFVAPFEI